MTFDQDDKGGASTLYRLLPTPKKMAEVWSYARDKVERRASGGDAEEDSDIDDADQDEVSARRASSTNSHRRRKLPSAAMGWRMGGMGAKKKLLPAQKIVEDWKRANSNKAAAVRKSGGSKSAGSSSAVDDADGERDGDASRSDHAGQEYSVTPMNPDEDAEVSTESLLSSVPL